MRRNHGFTLIEVMVGAMVCATFFVGLYRVYRAVISSMKRTQWTLKAQQHARTGLNFIREEMQRSSYKSTVKINETKIETATYEFYVNSTFPITGDGDIARWSICVPVPNDDSAILKSSLKMANGKLLYTRTGHPKAPNEAIFTNKEVMTDVASFDLSLEPFDPASQVPGTLVKFSVELRHPDRANFRNTRLVEQTAAKVEVEVIQGL